MSSSAATPDIGRIPVLSCQDQYAEWAIQVEASVGLAGVWDAFDGTNDTYLADPTIDLPTKRACSIIEQKARGLILKTISTLLNNKLWECQNPF